MAIACEFLDDGSCCNPVSNGGSRVAQRRRMKDAGVGLKRLLGSEVARNCRVGAQRHIDDRRG